MKDILIINTKREGYGVDQIQKTMTVAELISFLESYEEETPIYLSFDNGYTYGGITEYQISEDEQEDDDE